MTATTLTPPATTPTGHQSERRTSWIRVISEESRPTGVPLVCSLVAQADARYIGWRNNVHYLVHNSPSQ